MSLTLNRRKFLVVGAGVTLASTLPEASAGRFRDAVINFVEANYDSSLREITEEGLRRLVRKVLPIEDELEVAPLDLQVHFDQNWSSLGRDSTRAHTSSCPYCISVASEVQRRTSGLARVPNRIPRCFVINGAQYVVTEWGSLHRYYNGAVGGAEGTIWFESGTYVGRDHSGNRFVAMPNC